MDGQAMTRMVVSRAAGACVRAALIALLVALPTLLLGEVGASPVVALAALLAAAFTMSEYAAPAPTIVEFRDARPFNRLRAGALLAAVALAAVMLRGEDDRATLSLLLRALGDRLGRVADVPGSPVRLLMAALRADLDPALARGTRNAAAAAMLAAAAAPALFALALRLRLWPARRGFNLWVNLPQFDPRAGGDVVERLHRDGTVNLALGILLPFLLPAAFELLPASFGRVAAGSPVALTWTVAAWAFIPASLVMRGLALLRLSRLIALQRARARPEGELLPA